MGGIAAIALCAAFTSCSKSNDIYEGPQPTVEKTQLEKYQDAFVKEFGESPRSYQNGHSPHVDRSQRKESSPS